MPHNIVPHPAAAKAAAAGSFAVFARTEAALTGLIGRIDIALADLRRTEQLIAEADAAMDSGDIERMAAVAGLLRLRIDTRQAGRDSRRTAA